MTIKSKIQKNRVLISEIACKKFLNIVQNTKIEKFKYLPYHLQFQSNSFEHENNNTNQAKFQIYKRGAIVLVNFGINIGNELSGNHFAIVLSKSDHPKNSVLTVVPLSSKNKKIYLPLKDDIYKLENTSTVKYTIDHILPDVKKWYNIKIDGDKILKKLESNVVLLKELEKENSYNKENLAKDKRFIEICNESKILLNDLTEKEIMFENEREILLKNLNIINEAAKKYDKNQGKNSYAMIQNIQTISKLKIMKPINQFDPIGKIYISQESMKKIDIEIIKRFTTIPFNENFDIDFL